MLRTTLSLLLLSTGLSLTTWAQNTRATSPARAAQSAQLAQLDQAMQSVKEKQAQLRAMARQQLAQIPAMPSLPSMPSMPSMPSLPEMPSMPSMPSLPEMLAIAPADCEDCRDFTNDQDLKSKEVSQEISTSKNPEILIDNSSRNMVIKAWDQPKVKVTTTVFFEGEGKLSDEEWFEKLNLSLKTLGSSVRIKSGSIGGGSYTIGSGTFAYNSGGVAVFNGNGQNIGTKSGTKRIITVYVPAGSKMDIDSKYADVQLEGNFSNTSIDLTNGNLDAGNFSRLNLRSKYSNVTLGNVANAEIEFINGRLSTGNLDDADVDTKYSTVEIAAVKKLIFRSTNDEYEIENADDLRGRKNYGNLRINKLSSSLELDGTNADVRVRNLGANASLVRMNNKYADIRLPLREIKNFNINYVGPYSSVYGNFEKMPLKDEPKANPSSAKTNEDFITETIRSTNRALARANGEDGLENRFSAKGGDGKGLKIDLNCQNCTVDFK